MVLKRTQTNGKSKLSRNEAYCVKFRHKKLMKNVRVVKNKKGTFMKKGKFPKCNS